MSLSDRTRAFALAVIRLAEAFPDRRCANTVSWQLIGAASSPGAHFREALRARSKAEYTSKMNGGLMELQESVYWLEIAEGLELADKHAVAPLQSEAAQLIAIFVSLINKWTPRR